MTNDELRRLAEAATPGEWFASGKKEIGYISKADDQSCGMLISLADANTHEDAAYIAAANPSRILALLDEVERLRIALYRAQINASPLNPEN